MKDKHKHDTEFNEYFRLIRIIDELIDTNSNLVDTNSQLVGMVDRLTKPQPSSVQLILTSLVNNSNFKIMSLTLSSAQSAKGRLALVDKDTQNAIDATFANVSFAGTNTDSFTVEQDPDDPNGVIVRGVAEGSGQLTGQADATYVDGNTGATVTKTGTFSVDVTVTPATGPTPQNVEFQVNFDAPQNQ